MEKGKKKTGLIIGLIIFVVLAFGSLGVIVTPNITIRRGNILGEKLKMLINEALNKKVAFSKWWLYNQITYQICII